MNIVNDLSDYIAKKINGKSTRKRNEEWNILKEDLKQLRKEGEKLIRSSELESYFKKPYETYHSPSPSVEVKEVDKTMEG